MFIELIFYIMASGFEIRKEVSDAHTPTWCLEAELKDLQSASFLAEVDRKRITELETLLAVRSEMRA